MGAFQYVEYFLGYVLHSQRARDPQMFTRCGSFAMHRTPTVAITSPDCGPSGADLAIDYTQFGSSQFPQLQWTAPAGVAVQEWVVVVEDPDSPMPDPSLHGIYFKIPGTKTALTPADFELASETERGAKLLTGGFQLAMNRRGTIWTAPRPICGHGVHRYFFQVVGLTSELKLDTMSPVPSKLEIEDAVKDKIACWGEWIGNYERKWE